MTNDTEPVGSSIGEKIKQSQMWDYERFRESILALKSPFYYERLSEFPPYIELGPLWHKAHENIRLRTIGREMFGLVGISREYRTLLIQTVATPGLADKVPPEVISKITRKAVRNFNMEQVLGDIHSHPDGPPYFSTVDLFGLLLPLGNEIAFRGLVAGKYNSYIFKSWETEEFPLGELPRSKGEFTDLWNKRYKEPEARNYAIAEFYSLVLYRGESGKLLKREYPSI